MIKMRRGRTTRDAIPSMLKERKGGREGRKEGMDMCLHDFFCGVPRCVHSLYIFSNISTISAPQRLNSSAPLGLLSPRAQAKRGGINAHAIERTPRGLSRDQKKERRSFEYQKKRRRARRACLDINLYLSRVGLDFKRTIFFGVPRCVHSLYIFSNISTIVHLNASTPLHLWVSSLHARKQNEEE